MEQRLAAVRPERRVRAAEATTDAYRHRLGSPRPPKVLRRHGDAWETRSEPRGLWTSVHFGVFSTNRRGFDRILSNADLTSVINATMRTTEGAVGGARIADRMASLLECSRSGGHSGTVVHQTCHRPKRDIKSYGDRNSTTVIRGVDSLIPEAAAANVRKRGRRNSESMPLQIDPSMWKGSDCTIETTEPAVRTPASGFESSPCRPQTLIYPAKGSLMLLRAQDL